MVRKSPGWWWLAWWPFHPQHVDSGAAQAVQAAEQSAQRARRDREAAAATRAESEQVADQMRKHNVANRYDDWLAQILRGRVD